MWKYHRSMHEGYSTHDSHGITNLRLRVTELMHVLLPLGGLGACRTHVMFGQ